MLGLAASTAAVPIGLAPCDLRPGALNIVFDRAMQELGAFGRAAVFTDFDAATREIHSVLMLPPEWLR